jgi:hypothetical protein
MGFCVTVYIYRLVLCFHLKICHFPYAVCKEWFFSL